MAQNPDISQFFTIIGWALVIIYIFVHIMFFLSVAGKIRPDKELFENKLFIIMIIPTVLLLLIIGYIYFRCKGILHEKTIKDRADRELEIKTRMRYYGVEYFNDQIKPKN